MQKKPGGGYQREGHSHRGWGRRNQGKKKRDVFTGGTWDNIRSYPARQGRGAGKDRGRPLGGYSRALMSLGETNIRTTKEGAERVTCILRSGRHS